MILVSTKQESSNISPLSIAPKDDKETTLSFAALLKGLGDTEEDSKNIQNGSLVLSLVKEESNTKQARPTDKTEGKQETLLSLLKNDIKQSKDDPVEVKTVHTQVKKTSNDLPLELNPKITQSMTPRELKVVIHQAKQYIKSKIINSEAFVKEEIKSLPKTLKGLVQVAKKIGIDISKITLEQVQTDIKQERKKESITQLNDEVDIKVNVKKELRLEVKTESKLDISKRNSIEDIKTTVKDVKPEKTFATKQQIDEKVSTPLFKAQTKTEITTQDIVNVKATNREPQAVKQKTKNTLELLLRGDKIAKKDTNLTADFFVATARVIAPSAKTEVSKNLESLLNNSDNGENQTQSKTDGLLVHKAESFEVKLNEAKQMVKYLSQDVKNAIEDYKSPFTRVKVQLNPQKLGEVDLTIVQRGKNLHVNLSSNNAAINTLAMNANDLKVQLSNNGINNATLNFSNSSQSSDQGAGSQAQQQQQNRQSTQNEYNYFDNEENEEILSSLEIIVPHYV
jgi:flagellar hook-length control protein FliK